MIDYSIYKTKHSSWDLSEQEIQRKYQLLLEEELMNQLAFQAAGGGVTSGGLVLSLDAANTVSYPGSGTAWYDLSTYQNNAQLVNGPTSSGTGDQRILVFDATDDYYEVAPNPSLDCVKGVSAFALCKIQTVGIKQVIMKNDDIIDTNMSYGFQFWEDGYVYFNLRTANGWREFGDSTPYTADTWYYYGMTYDGKRLRGYRNGAQIGSVSWSGDIRLNPNGVRSSTASAVGGAGATQLSLSTVQVYDRALTDYEVNQNFVAIKNRFGL
jgi:hypothetical protein